MSKSQLTSEAICHQYHWLIRSVIAARRVREPDIDDVAQETLIAIHRSLHNYDPTAGEIDAWISCIAWRVASQHLKRESREALRRVTGDGELVHLSIPDPAPNGEEWMMEGEERRFLYAVLERMPDRRREAFELHAICGLTQADVGQVLSAPESTVQNWIRKAWDDINGAFKRRRAEQRRSGAQILGISAAALIERERVRSRDVSEEEMERALARFRRALDEERSREQNGEHEEARAACTPFEPNPPIRALPRKLEAVRSLLPGLTSSGISGAAGGLIMWALLHGDPSPNVTLRVVGSAVPNTGQMAPPPAGAGTGAAPLPVIAVSGAAVPSPVPPAPASKGAASSSVAPAALPSASRRTVLGAPPASDGEEAEENLLHIAKEALERGDIDVAKAALDHHERDYPAGKLKVFREALKKSLPR